MTDETIDINQHDNGTDKTTHRVKAIEAHWMETTIEYDPESITDVRTVHSETTESVQGTVFEWEYYCSCGEEFPDYDTAKTHLRTTADTLSEEDAETHSHE